MKKLIMLFVAGNKICYYEHTFLYFTQGIIPVHDDNILLYHVWPFPHVIFMSWCSVKVNKHKAVAYLWG